MLIQNTYNIQVDTYYLRYTNQCSDNIHIIVICLAELVQVSSLYLLSGLLYVRKGYDTKGRVE